MAIIPAFRTCGERLTRMSHEHCGHVSGTPRKMRAASSSIAFHISHSVHQRSVHSLPSSLGVLAIHTDYCDVMPKTLNLTTTELMRNAG